MTATSALTPSAANAAADRRAEQRQHETLDQQLSHQPSAARAERAAQRDLSLPSGRAAEQHVRDVGARDEQQQPDGGGHRVERRPESADDAVDEVR